MSEVKMYCVKCRRQVLVPNAHQDTVKGRSNVRLLMWKGRCPKCGTNTGRIIGKAR